MSSQTPPYSEPKIDVDSSASQTEENLPEFHVLHGRIPHAEIARVIEQMEASALTESVSRIFVSLLNLLNDLPVLENLGQSGPTDETDAALELFRGEARALVDSLLSSATATEEDHTLLSETLDGIAFALSHDLKRSFDSEFKSIDWKSNHRAARGRVAYVHGLLTNCLQQSIVTLAQVFDSSLDGAKLFENYQDRLRESLVLCRDLADIIQLVRASEKNVEQYFPMLCERVEAFRRESMPFLMYKDWQEFESLTESLLETVPEETGPGSPLHSLHCYLETLLGQVKLRAVLVDVFCDFFPDGEGTDPEWGEAQTRLAFELYRAKLSSMLERMPG